MPWALSPVGMPLYQAVRRNQSGSIEFQLKVWKKDTTFLIKKRPTLVCGKFRRPGQVRVAKLHACGRYDIMQNSSTSRMKP